MSSRNNFLSLKNIFLSETKNIIKEQHDDNDLVSYEEMYETHMNSIQLTVIDFNRNLNSLMDTIRSASEKLVLMNQLDDNPNELKATEWLISVAGFKSIEEIPPVLIKQFITGWKEGLERKQFESAF